MLIRWFGFISFGRMLSLVGLKKVVLRFVRSRLISSNFLLLVESVSVVMMKMVSFMIL